MSDDLNEKQKRFCEEYLVDLNATAAAKRTGYSAPTAHAQGHRLLGMDKVQAYIAELKAKRAERLEVTQDRVLQELARLGFSSVAALFDGEGRLKPVKDWPPEIAVTVASIETTQSTAEDGTIKVEVSKIRMWDKVGSLKLIGEHLSMFTKNVNLSGSVSLADRLRRAREKAGITPAEKEDRDEADRD